MSTAEIESSVAERPPARERILQTANRLFYAEGIQSVGIDRIIAEADVAKASLYKSYGSKNALIAAYLQGRHEAVLTRLRAAAEAVEEPREKIFAVFESHGSVFTLPTYRGCAFAAASAEAHPGDGILEATLAYRHDIHALLRELVEAFGVADPDFVARQLQLIYDGASQSVRMERDPSIAREMRASVETILDAAIAR